MDRKVIILPLHEGEEVYERVLKVDSNSEMERHAIGYREFIREKGLEYSGYEKDAGYNLAVYLMSLGYPVLQIDDMSIFYLPEVLTQTHSSWFKSKKNGIRRMSFSIVDMNEGNIDQYDAFTLEGVRPFHKFRELLANKRIVSDSSKEKGGM